ncbi:MAG: 2-C-methyl-D-erythritol 4-phosphate cytidylyltransferase [Bacteroidetes bacterium]|nr:2-C-methyl-D-erythritol 4-phosphate cytidylyltransferase [Rhodothermia bacterium]MCS7155804.1 2-C-methyl-D-erythritol 4-phosphate cytidylyltransferase [Bacteroidota bacterium]MCX7906095.1 2-C-methyl-D-erythritol 4-phosphate cytidylyltransferase [Bacteroidota bacterium]MDW8138223.1 2-C-methyl-D-erythritol 4-phosphate cytidylyltransferase [Bacteroidota bacterium]MDW8285907.1 2-C-methyl-D-erythritol 4-phosphate cytidylyltransferase [Bacteroidota bacterium]
MAVAALIPAAGSGSRMGGERPKQFRLLGELPLLVHTLRIFEHHPAVTAIYVSLPRAFMDEVALWVYRHDLRKVKKLLPGGRTRQESVWQALRAVPEEIEWVLVHDAVRPFVPKGLLDAIIEAMRAYGAAIPAVPVVDTLKRVDPNGWVQQTLDRAALRAAQTPQAFRRDLLMQAYERARACGLEATDEASLVEALGTPVRVVPGAPENRKLTTPEDWAWAEWWLQQQSNPVSGHRP